MQAKTSVTSSPASERCDGHGRASCTVTRMQPLIWERRPDRLRSPALVCAFKGWNDAGDAASAALHFVGASLEATRFRPDRPGGVLRLPATRPKVALGDDGIREIEWPTVELYEARVPRAGRDLILLEGPEPSMRWRTFCQQIVDLAEALGVEMVVTLGALLADVPHSRPGADHGPLGRRGHGRAPEPAALQLRGPDRHRRRPARRLPPGRVAVGEPVGGGAAPTSPPRRTRRRPLALVRKLETLVGVTVDAGELETAAADYERQVSLAVQSDPRRPGVRRAPRGPGRGRGSQLRPDRAALGRLDRPRLPAVPQAAGAEDR